MNQMVVAVGLGLVAGFSDAYGYLRWRAFGANMTGNTVLCAISLVRTPVEALFPLTLIAMFLAGSIAGRALTARLAAAPAFALEALLIAASVFVGGHNALAVVALAMGVQNASMRTFAGIQANTSFITGDYSKVGRAVADIALWRANDETRQTIAVIAPLIGAYFVGAAVAAFLSGIPLELLIVIPVILGVAYAARRT